MAKGVKKNKISVAARGVLAKMRQHFEKHYRELLQFGAKYGTCIVPLEYTVTEDDGSVIYLGEWLRETIEQREFNEENIPELYSALDDLALSYEEKWLWDLDQQPNTMAECGFKDSISSCSSSHEIATSSSSSSDVVSTSCSCTSQYPAVSNMDQVHVDEHKKEKDVACTDAKKLISSTIDNSFVATTSGSALATGTSSSSNGRINSISARTVGSKRSIKDFFTLSNPVSSHVQASLTNLSKRSTFSPSTAASASMNYSYTGNRGTYMRAFAPPSLRQSHSRTIPPVGYDGTVAEAAEAAAERVWELEEMHKAEQPIDSALLRPPTGRSDWNPPKQHYVVIKHPYSTAPLPTVSSSIGLATSTGTCSSSLCSDASSAGQVSKPKEEQLVAQLSRSLPERVKAYVLPTEHTEQAQRLQPERSSFSPLMPACASVAPSPPPPNATGNATGNSRAKPCTAIVLSEPPSHCAGVEQWNSAFHTAGDCDDGHMACAGTESQARPFAEREDLGKGGKLEVGVRVGVGGEQEQPLPQLGSYVAFAFYQEDDSLTAAAVADDNAGACDGADRREGYSDPLALCGPGASCGKDQQALLGIGKVRHCPYQCGNKSSSSSGGGGGGGGGGMSTSIDSSIAYRSHDVSCVVELVLPCSVVAALDGPFALAAEAFALTARAHPRPNQAPTVPPSRATSRAAGNPGAPPCCPSAGDLPPLCAILSIHDDVLATDIIFGNYFTSDHSIQLSVSFVAILIVVNILIITTRAWSYPDGELLLSYCALLNIALLCVWYLPGCCLLPWTPVPFGTTTW